MPVPEGSVFGFIGQNGAGKTTTMKMVLGLLRPDQGEIRVCDEPTSALDAREQFYKNISGVGFSAFIMLFGSCTSGEYSVICGVRK